MKTVIFPVHLFIFAMPIISSLNENMNEKFICEAPYKHILKEKYSFLINGAFNKEVEI